MDDHYLWSQGSSLLYKWNHHFQTVGADVCEPLDTFSPPAFGCDWMKNLLPYCHPGGGGSPWDFTHAGHKQSEMEACSPSVNCSRSRSSSHSLIWSVIVGGRNGVWEGPNTRYHMHNINLLSLLRNTDGSRVGPDLSEHDRMSPGPQEVDNLTGKRPLLPSGGRMVAMHSDPQVLDNLGSFTLSNT